MSDKIIMIVDDEEDVLSVLEMRLSAQDILLLGPVTAATP